MGKKSTEIDIKDKIIQATLTLTKDLGWENITLQDIAEEADIPIAELFQLFQCKQSIIDAFAVQIDANMLRQMDDTDMTVRDRILDLLAERFDLLNDHRDAVLSILNSYFKQPHMMIRTLPFIGNTMGWILEAAGENTSTPKGAIKVLGLSGIYLRALYVWRSDETKDLSKTLACLDKSLGQAEKMAERFGL